MDFIPLPLCDFSHLLSPSRPDQCGFYTECGIYSMRNRSTRVWVFVEIRPLEWLTVSRISINKFLVCPISRIIPIARRKRRGRKEEIKRKSILYIYLEGKCLIKSTTSFFSDNFKWLISFHSSPKQRERCFRVVLSWSKNKVQGSRQVDRRGLESETIHFSRFLRWRGSWWSSNHPPLPFVLSRESQFSLLRAEVAVFVAKIAVDTSVRPRRKTRR